MNSEIKKYAETLEGSKKNKKFETLAGGWDFLNSGGGCICQHAAQSVEVQIGANLDFQVGTHI